VELELFEFAGLLDNFEDKNPAPADRIENKSIK
jgi:hypothetical protein